MFALWFDYRELILPGFQLQKAPCTRVRQDVRQRPKDRYRPQKLYTFAHRYTTAAGRVSYPAIEGEFGIRIG
jgi:hypothetical protein